MWLDHFELKVPDSHPEKSGEIPFLYAEEHMIQLHHWASPGVLLDDVDLRSLWEGVVEEAGAHQRHWEVAAGCLLAIDLHPAVDRDVEGGVDGHQDVDAGLATARLDPSVARIDMTVVLRTAAGAAHEMRIQCLDQAELGTALAMHTDIEMVWPKSPASLPVEEEAHNTHAFAA